jgi:hypothetical protein
MWRLAVALAGCQTVFAPFMGDGGPIKGGTTVIGGNSNPDLAVTPDASVTSKLSGVIVAHSGAPSRISAAFSGCPTMTVSGCRFRDCPSPDMGGSALDVNAGAITVMTPTGSNTLSPQSNGSYLPLTLSSPLWAQTGAKVNVSATGADYAPFAVTVDGPTTITVTNPLAGGTVDVPRTADFSLSWVDGTTGHVTVEIAAGTQDLACDFVVTADSGIVPRQALSMLTAGAGTMTIVVASSTTTDSVIDVTAEVAGVDSGGQPFSANVNLR